MLIMTPAQYKQLDDLLHKCNVYTYVHGMEETKNRKYDTLTDWLQKSLSAIVGVVSVSHIGSNDNIVVQDTSSVITTVLLSVGAVMSFSATLVGIARSSLRFSQKHTSHGVSRQIYNDIAENINSFFSGIEKEPFAGFVALTQKAIHVAMSASPSIDEDKIAAAMIKLRMTHHLPMGANQNTPPPPPLQDIPLDNV